VPPPVCDPAMLTSESRASKHHIDVFFIAVSLI